MSPESPPIPRPKPKPPSVSRPPERMTVPTDSPRGIANMPEAAKSPTVDLDGLKTLLRFPDPDTEKAESAIDAASADASAKKSLGEALYRELERGGFSPESGPKEVCLASALVRLHDGPNTKIDATFSDALYSRYTALKAPYVAETVAESTGAKELLDVAVRKIVERGVGHLSSPEGIQFGIDHLHAEVVGTLAEIDAGLPPEHPLKGLSTPLIENFLIPPENGKRLIRYSVNRLFPNEHENPESEKSRGNLYDTARVMVRGSVGMLLDFAQADDPGVPARMREVIERMEADPWIKDFLAKFPDLLGFFKDSPPEVLRTVDKTRVIEWLDRFFSSCRGDFLMLSGVSPEENESQKASLRIANAGAAFLRSLVTPQNASALISDASKLAAVRSNPMFHDLVSLVDDRSGLTPEDRAALADRILEWVDCVTTETIDDARLTSYFDALLRDVANLADKIPADRLDRAVASVIRPFLQNLATENKNESWTLDTIIDTASSAWSAIYKVDDWWAAFATVWANRGWAQEYVASRFRGETFETVESVVKFMRENKILEQNIDAAWGALFSRIRQIVSMNVAQDVARMRDSMMGAMPSRITLPQEHVQTLRGWSFQERLAGRVASDLGGIFRAKLSGGAVETGWNLTGRELISVGIESVRSFLQENRSEAVVFMRQAWLVIREWDEAAFGSLLDSMLSNPRFAGLVERIISGAGSRVAKSADYANEIKSIISELASQGIGSPLVSAEARQEGLRLSVETAYEQIRQNPSIAKAVLSALGIEQIGRMTDADVIRTAELFVRMIPKECVMRSFSQLAAKNPAEVRLADILASGKQLIEQLPKDRLDSLVDELRKQGILSRMIATPDARPQQSWKSAALEVSDIREGVRLLYAARGSLDSETFGWVTKTIAGPLGTLLGKGLDIVIRDIRPDAMARALSSSNAVQLINEALSWRLDTGNQRTQERILELAASLYESVPEPKRAKFMASLAESGIVSEALLLSKSGKTPTESGAIIVSESMLDNLARLAYRTIDWFQGPDGPTRFASNFRSIASQALPGTDIDSLLSTKVFGAPLGENIHAILSSIAPVDFVRILRSHRNEIQSMARWERSWMEQLGIDIALAIDPEKFRRSMDGRKLSELERASVDNLGAIQALLRDTPGATELIREWRAFVENIERAALPSREKMADMSTKIFSLMQEVSKRLPQVLRAGLDGTMKSDGENSGSDLPKWQLATSIVLNNFWFGVFNLSSVLSDLPKASMAYFGDNSNRKNFTDTFVECAEIYAKSRKPKIA